jgi:hypothetical protein
MIDNSLCHIHGDRADCETNLDVMGPAFFKTFYHFKNGEQKFMSLSTAGIMNGGSAKVFLTPCEFANQAKEKAMNTVNLTNLVGKQVIVKGRSELTLPCQLVGLTDYGLILSSSDKAAQFSNRLYPWAAIDYVDLDVSANAQTKVA